jgi:lysophospholipase L1-like esterase
MRKIRASLLLLLAAFAVASAPVEGDVMIKNGDSIAFLGDSITYLAYTNKENGWINLVIDGLKQAGVTATPIPAGIGGNTTVDMLKREDADVIAKKPVWMTLNSGTNDLGKGITVEEFAQNLATLVDKATAAGIKVILMNTTVGALQNPSVPTTPKRIQYCDEFRKLAEARHLPLVDLYAATNGYLEEHKNEGEKGLKISVDGTHPNGLGNQIIATAILRTLGVSEKDLAVLSERWKDNPSAVAMPELSISDYLKLSAIAEKNHKTPDEQVTAILSAPTP